MVLVILYRMLYKKYLHVLRTVFKITPSFTCTPKLVDVVCGKQK